MARTSITRRLTTAYALVMACVLIGSGITIYIGERFSLDRSLKRDLARQSDELAQLVDQPGNLKATALLDRSDSYAQILDHDGAIIAATPPLQDQNFLTPKQLRQAQTGTHTFERGSITSANRHTLRIRTHAIREGGNRRIVVAAVRRDLRDEALRELIGQLLGIGALALALTAAVGYRLTRAALAPVEHIREQADQLYHQDTSDRLGVPDTGDELARLATTLNDMLARIDATVARERTFAADASHELRTPLAALKSEIDLALHKPRTNEDLTAALTNARGDVERLIQLAEDLLLVIRTPTEQLGSQLIEVTALLEQGITRARAQAPGRVIQLQESQPANVHGSSALLARAIDNLLANAIDHGAGTITAATQQNNGTVQIHVTDDGPGFPESFLPDAFARFTRADPGRTGANSGLGLSIVKTIATAHGGTVGARNRTDGGADAWIELPLPD